MADSHISSGVPEPLVHGTGSALGLPPFVGTDSLSLTEVSPSARLVCSSFRESVPEEPAMTSTAMCLAPAQRQRSAIECLQDQMLAFQSAMQHQMEALTSFVVNSQPLVVPALHREAVPEATPHSEVVISQPSPSGSVPPPPVVKEVIIPPSISEVVSQPSSVFHPPEIQVEDISPALSLKPSLLASSRDDASVVDYSLAARTPSRALPWRASPFTRLELL